MIAKFSLNRATQRQGLGQISLINYTLISVSEIEDVAINMLLENNNSVIVNNVLYIKLPNGVNNLIQEFGVENFLENESVLFLDSESILFNMFGYINPVIKGTYKVVGEPLFNRGTSNQSANFKKLFGKNYSIYKMI